jgi:WD40 repeat protein
MDDPNEDMIPVPEGKVNLVIEPGMHTGRVVRAFFSDDGKQLITTGFDSTIRVWDVESGEQVRVIFTPGRFRPVTTVMSKDRRRLAVASIYPEKDRQVHAVHLLSMPEGRLERTLRLDQGTIGRIAISPDGNRLAMHFQAGRQQGVRLWDLTRDGQPETILKGVPVQNMAFSPDGRRLAWVSRQKGQIVDLETGKVEASIPGGQVAWSPDGNTIAASMGPDVRFHDVKTGMQRHFKGDTACGHLAFSPDSRTLLCALRPGNNHLMAALLDVESATEKLRFRPGPRFGRVTAGGAISPDGQLVAIVGGGEVSLALLWRAKDGEIVREIKSPWWLNGGAAYVVPAWSKDGKVASCYAAGFGNHRFHLFKFGAFHFGELDFVQTLSAEPPAGAGAGRHDPEGGQEPRGSDRKRQGHCQAPRRHGDLLRHGASGPEPWRAARGG